MPADMQLLGQGRILKFTISHPWKATDLTDLEMQELAIRDAAPHRIHTIVYVKDRQQVPPGLLQLRRLPTLTHPRSGHIAVVGTSAVLQRIAETALLLAHNERARFFDTEADALTYLQSVIEAETT